MSPSELFDIWAPPAALWSRWAKPVLFAESSPTEAIGAWDLETLPVLPNLADHRSAIVVDLPGPDSVKIGLALARAGYRPIPLFNGARGPQLTDPTSAAIDNQPILEWLNKGASLLSQTTLSFDAPPAFLLDSRRNPRAGRPGPGRFDNRWIVFPQDFPSANFLRDHGMDRVLLLQSELQTEPQEDLTHVLLRWQEAGLPLLLASPNQSLEPQPLRVSRPSWFRALWYCALAIGDFRRNSAGGFGSIVPRPNSGVGLLT